MRAESRNSYMTCPLFMGSLYMAVLSWPSSGMQLPKQSWEGRLGSYCECKAIYACTCDVEAAPRHTMTLRFPEVRDSPMCVRRAAGLRIAQDPTPDQRNALDSYFHLFSRLYPCGECATEFQQLLRKYPPQVRHVQFSLIRAPYALMVASADILKASGGNVALLRAQPR